MLGANLIRAVAVLAVSSTCASCTSSQGDTGDLQQEVNDLKKNHREMQLTVSGLLIDQEAAQYAYLTPGSDGYFPVRTTVGNLSVSFEDIKPYASGSKIRLRFGNPLNADFMNARFTLEWSSKTAAEPNSKSVSLTQKLVSGYWTDTEVVLDGTPPADLGFLRVRDFNTGTMYLAGPK